MSALFDFVSFDERIIWIIFGGAIGTNWTLVSLMGQGGGQTVASVPDADTNPYTVTLIATPVGGLAVGTLVVWNPNILRLAIPTFTPNPAAQVVRGALIGRIYSHATYPFLPGTSLVIIEMMNDDSWFLVSVTELTPYTQS
jgi:hypothetical protein